MNFETALQLILCILSIGITYGSLNNRIKTIEKRQDEHKDIGERLARIETNLEILLKK